MVSIRHIKEDYNHCSYITVVDGNNETYFIRTIIDPNDSSRIRTIVYKRLPNNPVALQLHDVSKRGVQFAKQDMHEYMVDFVAHELLTIEKDIFKNNLD